MDSFKGCLSSAEVEAAAEEGVRSVYPDCSTFCIPIADGGEGWLNSLLPELGSSIHRLSVHGPLMDLVFARYGITKDGRTAILEMAETSGLMLVPIPKRNPMLTTSLGAGELILHLMNQGIRHFIIGIGGSATNDGGIGMLQALGFLFYNHQGGILSTGCGEMMCQVARMDMTFVDPALKDTCFTVACDVDNPFYGPNGAAYTFAIQKGADEQMVESLDMGLRSLSEVYRRTTGIDVGQYPGAGAAGGVGGAFLSFMHGKLQPGVQLVLNTLGFEKQIAGADLIITGEGKADRQTMMGKVPYGVLEEAKEQQIPVVLIAGRVENADMLLSAGFQGVYQISPDSMPLEEAMEPNYTRNNIKRTVAKILCSL